jgi:hypothetical protein
MDAAEQRPPLDPHPLSDWVAWSGRRNRDAILSVLRDRLPKTPGRILELASGSGMHIHYFAPHLQHLTLQPSDKDDETFASIRRLSAETGLTNVQPPITLDLTQPSTWPSGEDKYVGIFCINVIHVAPTSVTAGLAECASRLLAKGGVLMIYGAFKTQGRYSTPSSAELDQAFRSIGDGEWGFKDTVDVTAACAKHGLALEETIDMPDGRLMLRYARG